MSESTRSPLPATVLASLAFAVSAFLLVRYVRDGDRSPAPATVQVADDGRAQARDVDVAPREPRAEPVLRSVDVGRAGDEARRELVENAIHELAERIAQLEARMAQMQNVVSNDAPEPIDRRPPKSPEQHEQERLERVQTARATILDPRMTEEQKLDAWGELRGAGEDAWDHATIAEMTRIGLTSADPEIRADVWRQADADARSEALVPALIQALAQDAHPQAREEAAETLANYRELAHVRMALESAAANDDDEGVRRQAANSLRRSR